MNTTTEVPSSVETLLQVGRRILREAEEAIERQKDDEREKVAFAWRQVLLGAQQAAPEIATWLPIEPEHGFRADTSYWPLAVDTPFGRIGLKMLCTTQEIDGTVQRRWHLAEQDEYDVTLRKIQRGREPKNYAAVTWISSRKNNRAEPMNNASWTWCRTLAEALAHAERQTAVKRKIEQELRDMAEGQAKAGPQKHEPTLGEALLEAVLAAIDDRIDERIPDDYRLD